MTWNPLYYNHASLCFLGKDLAAKERKEQESSHFHLCDLYVLLRLSSVVAAQAALGSSAFICVHLRFQMNSYGFSGDQRRLAV